MNEKECFIRHEFRIGNNFAAGFVDNIEAILVFRIPLNPILERLSFGQNGTEDFIQAHHVRLLNKHNIVFR